MATLANPGSPPVNGADWVVWHYTRKEWARYARSHFYQACPDPMLLVKIGSLIGAILLPMSYCVTLGSRSSSPFWLPLLPLLILFGLCYGAELLRVPVPAGYEAEAQAFVKRFESEVIPVHSEQYRQRPVLPPEAPADPAPPAPCAAPTRRLPGFPIGLPDDHPTQRLPPLL